METGLRDRLVIAEGDITLSATEAIVNAANTTLLGGGGVDGAIHRAAGPGLLGECRKIGGCPTGSARITRGYNLRAKRVIHTVGPVWRGGHDDEDRLLACCYRSSFDLAHSHGIRTMAFPSISTGAYGFPVGRASKIALEEIFSALRASPRLERVVVFCFDRETYATYGKNLNELP